ncbi:MAG TPA: hypothetical protein VF089_20230 [Candidatus Binatia bacterium]
MKSVGFTLVILLLKGNAFAQQAKEQPQPGRYHVVTGKVAFMDSMVLVDTWTGKTWKIGPGDTWTPMTRLDTPEQVKEWAQTHPKTSTATDKVKELAK